MCCGSGCRSGRIRIILPDPDQRPGHADPDRYQFQANDKVNKLYFFPVFRIWITVTSTDPDADPDPYLYPKSVERAEIIPKYLAKN
jgi:hypothetical protein